jgi:hypothetical protein
MNWTETNAYFKQERGFINIGLGRGPAVDIVNDGLRGYSEIPR